MNLGITLGRNKIWAWDLYHSTALIEVVKSLTPLNVKGSGKVPYQKTSAKVYGACIAQCIGAMLRC